MQLLFSDYLNELVTIWKYGLLARKNPWAEVFKYVQFVYCFLQENSLQYNGATSCFKIKLMVTSNYYCTVPFKLYSWKWFWYLFRERCQDSPSCNIKLLLILFLFCSNQLLLNQLSVQIAQERHNLVCLQAGMKMPSANAMHQF